MIYKLQVQVQVVDGDGRVVKNVHGQMYSTHANGQLLQCAPQIMRTYAFEQGDKAADDMNRLFWLLNHVNKVMV